mgnify:FL=1
MRRTALAILASVLLILLGVTLLKGSVALENDDPTASVANGAPRGLLALSLLFAARDAPVSVLRSFNDPAPADGTLLVVPPPERSSWTEQEAVALLAWVDRGGRALVLCDEDDARNRRLGALLEAVGVSCERVDVAIGDVALTSAQGTMAGFARELAVRGAGRVRPKGPTPVVPAWRVGNDDVVIKRQLGAGLVTVVGSATVLTNDGLATADNAVFALDEQRRAPAAVVVFDERHHHLRHQGAWAAALTRGLGPLTALLALLLLVPLSLLGLAPRPGDAPRGEDDDDGAPAAAAQARALAALLARAGR